MADLDHHLPAIVAGDPVAFGRWVAGAEPRLRDSLRPLAASVDTEAVLQESLLRIWQVAPRFVSDGRPDGLLRLAIRIARNLSFDELRKRRVDPASIESLEAAAAAGDESASSEPDPLLRKAIAECREKLDGKPARALEARLTSQGSESDEDLAARLSMKLNTFLQNVTRARRLLAECLKKRGVEFEVAR
jgi:RNA polymerase sigma-70 factor (ECF subfamily)